MGLRFTCNGQGRNTINDQHLAYSSSRRCIPSVLHRPPLGGNRSTVHNNRIARNVTCARNDMTLAKNMWTFLPAVVNAKNKAFSVRSLPCFRPPSHVLLQGKTCSCSTPNSTASRYPLIAKSFLRATQRILIPIMKTMPAVEA